MNNHSTPLIEDQSEDTLANCRDLLEFLQISLENYSEDIVLNQRARQG